MGLDLTLLPVQHDAGTYGYSHTVLDLDRRRGLWEAVGKLPQHGRPTFKLNAYGARIPDGTWKGERAYGEVKETPYGEPLQYATAADLAECIGLYHSTNETETRADVWTRAVLAHLRALPPDTPVALYWH